jgi:hypothetical protein
MPVSFSRAVKPIGSWLLASLAVWAAALWLFGFKHLGPLPEVVSAVAAASDVVEATSDESVVTIPDRFGSGDTLSSVLSRNGFDALEVHEMGQALSAVMDVRRLRQGDEVEIHFGSGGADSVVLHHGEL